MTRTKAAKRAIPAADRVIRPHAKTAATRERILDAAMAVFAARGYNNGSLLEIAEQAGMTHAGVLHHFGSKDQLLVAVLEHRDQADVAHLEGQHAPQGRELLRHLVETARMNVARGGLVQTYAVLSAESVTDGHPAQDFFRTRFEGLSAMIAESLAAVAPDGIAPERLTQAASAIIAVMDGLQVQWLLNPSSVDMPATLTTVLDGLVAALNDRTAPSVLAPDPSRE